MPYYEIFPGTERNASILCPSGGVFITERNGLYALFSSFRNVPVRVRIKTGLGLGYKNGSCVIFACFRNVAVRIGIRVREPRKVHVRVRIKA